MEKLLSPSLCESLYHFQSSSKVSPLDAYAVGHIYLLPDDQTFSFPQSAQLHRKYSFNVLLFATLSVRCFSFVHIWNPLI